MSVLELKGGMIELIAQVKNKETLQQLYDIMADFIIIEADNIKLSPEQEAKLGEDLKISYDKKRLLSLEDSKEKMNKWLHP